MKIRSCKILNLDHRGISREHWVNRIPGPYFASRVHILQRRTSGPLKPIHPEDAKVPSTSPLRVPTMSHLIANTKTARPTTVLSQSPFVTLWDATTSRPIHIKRAGVMGGTSCRQPKITGGPAQHGLRKSSEKGSPHPSFPPMHRCMTQLQPRPLQLRLLSPGRRTRPRMLQSLHQAQKPRRLVQERD